MSNMPYPSVRANLISLMRWMRHGRWDDRDLFLATTTPDQLANWLDQLRPQRVARLFIYTLTIMERKGGDDSKWFARIGVSAWRALLRSIIESDHDTSLKILNRCQLRSEYLRNDLFETGSPDYQALTGFGIRELSEMQADLNAEVSLDSKCEGPTYTILNDFLNVIFRCSEHHICTNLGPLGSTKTRVPLRNECSAQNAPDGLIVRSPGLPDILLRANAIHWDIVADGHVIGWAPPLDRIRIASIIVRHWASEWLRSAAWLPADIHVPRHLPPDVLERLTWHIPGLHFRVKGNGKPGIWALAVAVAIADPLSTAAKLFPDEVCYVWKRICAVFPLALSAPANGPLFHPHFWSEHMLVRDVLNLRGAATIVRSMHRDYVTETDQQWQEVIRQENERLLTDGWIHMCCAPDVRPNRALRITLSNCPGGLPITVFSPFLLRRINLPRPRTTRREFLAALAVARWQARGGAGQNGRIMLMATDNELHEALNWDHTHGNIDSLRSGKIIGNRMLDWLDFPTPVGSVSSLVRRSHDWHRMHARHLQTPGEMMDDNFHPAEERYPADMPLAQIPIVLPAMPEDGVTIRFLGTVGDLQAEGNLMNHCVSFYAPRAITGNCFLLHVDVRGEPATVELDKGMLIVQAKAPNNRSNIATEWSCHRLPGLIANAPHVLNQMRCDIGSSSNQP